MRGFDSCYPCILVRNLKVRRLNFSKLNVLKKLTNNNASKRAVFAFKRALPVVSKYHFVKNQYIKGLHTRVIGGGLATFFCGRYSAFNLQGTDLNFSLRPLKVNLHYLDPSIVSPAFGALVGNLVGTGLPTALNTNPIVLKPVEFFVQNFTDKGFRYYISVVSRSTYDSPVLNIGGPLTYGSYHSLFALNKDPKGLGLKFFYHKLAAPFYLFSEPNRVNRTSFFRKFYTQEVVAVAPTALLSTFLLKWLSCKYTSTGLQPKLGNAKHRKSKPNYSWRYINLLKRRSFSFKKNFNFLKKVHLSRVWVKKDLKLRYQSITGYSAGYNFLPKLFKRFLVAYTPLYKYPYVKPVSSEVSSRLTPGNALKFTDLSVYKPYFNFHVYNKPLNILLLFIKNPVLSKLFVSYRTHTELFSMYTRMYSLYSLRYGDLPQLASNVLPTKHFDYYFSKKIGDLNSYKEYDSNIIPWYYHTLIRFIESVSGYRSLLQFYPFMFQEVHKDFITRYKLWLPRMHYYERKLGHRFFLEEAIHILHLGFFLRDPTIIAAWLKSMILRISFWKTRSIFRFVKYILNNYFLHIFNRLGVFGLKIKLKGKISVAGNSRKRTILYRVGKTSHSTVNLRVLHDKRTINTFTGVMGFQVWLFY